MTIRRITVVEMTPEGPRAQVVSESKSKRKVSKGLKPAEKAQRRVLEAQVAFAREALDAHEKLTQKRGDRWLTDAPTVVFKATRAAMKRLNKM